MCGAVLCGGGSALGHVDWGCGVWCCVLWGCCVGVLQHIVHMVVLVTLPPTLFAPTPLGPRIVSNHGYPPPPSLWAFDFACFCLGEFLELSD